MSTLKWKYSRQLRAIMLTLNNLSEIKRNLLTFIVVIICLEVINVLLIREGDDHLKEEQVTRRHIEKMEAPKPIPKSPILNKESGSLQRLQKLINQYEKTDQSKDKQHIVRGSYNISAIAGDDKEIPKIKIDSFVPHKNPPATVTTTLNDEYKKHTVKMAYLGLTFSRSSPPEEGDEINIKFKMPVQVRKFRFVTGNSAYPHDILSHGVVEVLTEHETPEIDLTGEGDKDGNLQKRFQRVATFDRFGVAEQELGLWHEKISEITIRIMFCAHKLVISEMYIEQMIEK